MSNYKYPYIEGGKKMVAAVLGACSYIRETGYFNKAVSYYADKYGVDEEELADNIRKRQAAGRKAKAAETGGRKFKYYVVGNTSYCDAMYDDTPSDLQIVRGLSKKTVENRFSERDWKETYANDTGSSWSPIFRHTVLGEYETKQEAEDALEAIMRGDYE
jgi:hypothetical protein